jgi:hypothetical protein
MDNKREPKLPKDQTYEWVKLDEKLIKWANSGAKSAIRETTLQSGAEYVTTLTACHNTECSLEKTLLKGEEVLLIKKKNKSWLIFCSVDCQIAASANRIITAKTNQQEIKQFYNNT